MRPPLLFPFLAEQADALGSRRSVFRHVGSRPTRRTTFIGPLAQLFWHGHSHFRWPEQPALNRKVEGSIPSRSTNSLLRLRLAAGRRALNAITQVRTLEPQPVLICHVNSAARVLPCLGRSQGFESPTWRHDHHVPIAQLVRAPG